MAGRRPTPDVIKQLAGNPGKRPIKPMTKAAAGDATMPSIVREDKIAAAEWRRLAPQLNLLGLIDASNQQTFAAYCLSWSLFVQAKRQIQTEGFTYKTDSGQIKKHPAYEAMRSSGAEMRKFGAEHGISPISRSRAQPSIRQGSLPGVPEKPSAPTTPPGDDNDRFFGGGAPVH